MEHILYKAQILSLPVVLHGYETRCLALKVKVYEKWLRGRETNRNLEPIASNKELHNL
jgi:hypothetical protein